jgi:RNA 2',3'-cyclic 3'-phosphodiesterase
VSTSQLPAAEELEAFAAGIAHELRTPLAALAGEVDGALATVGSAPESRPFAAHVTLGRVRQSRRNPALAAALARPAECGRLTVARVSLMQSELHPRGARYTELTSVVLAGAGSPVE